MQLVLQPGTGEGVERAEWLVHQQHLGFHGQSPGDAHALLHAAGNFMRVPVRCVRQADELQRSMGAGLELLRAFSGCEHALHAEMHVAEAGQPGQQRVILEHHRAIRPGRGNFAAIADHHAGTRQGEAGEEVEQGALAAAGVADQADELPAGDVEIDVAQGVEGAACGVENHVDPFDDDMAVHARFLE
ncbi:hypothetical protein GALL_446500 [mine drainage metagenome]|uniref:Uncharacterized protein n=1 Tax=mine drainage metagenome TaxID=410659 RepID=A0A1J5PSC8_9ZZZZ